MTWAGLESNQPGGALATNGERLAGTLAVEKPASGRPRATRDQVPTPRERWSNKAPLGRMALNQLSECEGECRDASGEHDESECRDASRNQPEPSRSELPSQIE
jgi:hypothetical protein